MTFRTTVAALTAVCALVGGSAQAAVIYSSFGPEGSFDRYRGFSVWADGSSYGFETWTAMAFTSAGDFDVTQISLAVGASFGDLDMEVSLWSKDLTTQLGTWTITAPSARRRWPATTITGITGVHLEAGGEYALVAKSTNDGDGIWAWGSEDIVGGSQEHTAGHAFDYGYGVQGAFEVQGDATAVPEPATWALMIVGFGGAGAMLRNRRRRVTA
jgi:hypothetical protein